MGSQLMEAGEGWIDWRDDLEAWIEPFVVVLRHKTRGRMCPSYLAGLIGPGDRKSAQPLGDPQRGCELRPVARFCLEWRLGCGPQIHQS